VTALLPWPHGPAREPPTHLVRIVVVARVLGVLGVLQIVAVVLLAVCPLILVRVAPRVPPRLLVVRALVSRILIRLHAHARPVGAFDALLLRRRWH